MQNKFKGIRGVLFRTAPRKCSKKAFDIIETERKELAETIRDRQDQIPNWKRLLMQVQRADTIGQIRSIWDDIKYHIATHKKNAGLSFIDIPDIIIDKVMADDSIMDDVISKVKHYTDMGMTKRDAREMLMSGRDYVDIFTQNVDRALLNAVKSEISDNELVTIFNALLDKAGFVDMEDDVMQSKSSKKNAMEFRKYPNMFESIMDGKKKKVPEMPKMGKHKVAKVVSVKVNKIQNQKPGIDFLLPMRRDLFDEDMGDYIGAISMSDPEKETEVFINSGYTEDEIMNVWDELRTLPYLGTMDLPKPVTVDVEISNDKIASTKKAQEDQTGKFVGMVWNLMGELNALRREVSHHRKSITDLGDAAYNLSQSNIDEDSKLVAKNAIMEVREVRSEFNNVVAALGNLHDRVKAMSTNLLDQFNLKKSGASKNAQMEDEIEEPVIMDSTWTVQVIDTINDDKMIQDVRVKNPDHDYLRYLNQYGKGLLDKAWKKREGQPRYVVQLLKDGDIVKDNQGHGGSVRTFEGKKKADHVLSKGEKKVIEAFANKQPAHAGLLESDGQKLETVGFIGSGTIATWGEDDKIHMDSSVPSSRFQMTIIRFLKTVAPRMDFADSWVASKHDSFTKEDKAIVSKLARLLNDKNKEKLMNMPMEEAVKIAKKIVK